MKKRILSVIIIIALLGSLVLIRACGAIEPTTTIDIPTDMQITRGEWISGLSQTFGMDGYSEEIPYFKDIDASSDIFAQVQACVEWGLFKKAKGNFNPDELLTREFAIQTAVVASEVLNYIPSKDRFEKSIDYALTEEIITSSERNYLCENISALEAQKILDWAFNKYLNRDFVEYNNVKLKDDVIDMSTYTMDIVSSPTGNIITIYNNDQELQIGDVLLTPISAENLAGSAQKVVTLHTNENGSTVIETIHASLEEIYEELDFAVSVIPDIGNFIASGGVEASVVDTASTVGYWDLAYTSSNNSTLSDYSVVNTSTFTMPEKSITFSYSEGDVNINASWNTSFLNFSNEITLTESKKNDNDKKELLTFFEKSNVLYETDKDTKKIQKIENKYSGGFEISGNLTLKDFVVDVELTTNNSLGIQSFSVNTSYTMEDSLTLVGELEDELTIGCIPIYVPAVWGLVINVDIVLYADVNGDLEVKLVTTSANSLSYSGNSIKKANETTLVPSFSAAADIGIGAGVVVRVELFTIDITDVKLKIGTEFGVESSMRYDTIEEPIENGTITHSGWIWSVTAQNTSPIVTLEFGKNEESLLELNLSWELVGENGLIKVEPKLFFEKEYLIGDTKKKMVMNDVEEFLINPHEWYYDTSDEYSVSYYNNCKRQIMRLPINERR